MNKIINEEIRRRVNTQPAEKTAYKNKIRWWSHVKRMAPTAPQTRALEMQPVGKRRRRRSKNRWEDDVYTEMVQTHWDPDDRSQQLGEGQTSDCIST